MQLTDSNGNIYGINGLEITGIDGKPKVPSSAATLIVNSTPITSGTVGRVLFQGAGNVLQQSGNLFFDATNNRLGIGTASPSAIIHAVGSVTAATAIARGNYLQPTLIASANSDVLVGLEINPTFTNGAFTGVKNNWINLVGNASVNFTNQLYLKRADIDVLFASSVETQLKTVSSSSPLKFFVGSTSQYAQFFATTGNLTLQNGGTFTDAGYRLDVQGTARLNGLTAINGAGVANTALAVYGNGNGGGNYLFRMYDASSVERFYLTASGNFRLNGATDTSTTGTDEKWRMVLNFAPTSGTRQHNGIYLTQTINQTGGANGVTRGLLIEPTLTAAADYRAIETTVGKVCLNTTSGNTMIGTTTDAGFKLDVNGTARVSGTTTITPAALTGTAATSALDISQTWNTTGTPIALKVNITDTASAALSDLISLQVGGSVRFRVLKSGFFALNGSGEILGSTLIGGTAINASSQLEVRSTTKGFLPPRMTTTQKNAIASPATGLVVFDTTLGKLCVFSTTWQTVTSV